MPHFLGECLESLRLSASRLEIIVVDDGSPAQERDAARAFVEQIAGARWVARERNGGVHAALNTGLAAATGEFVLFRGADDRFIEPGLQMLLDALEQRRDAPLVAAPTRYFRKDLERGALEGVSGDTLVEIVPRTVGGWLRGRFINGGSVAVRRSLVVAAGGHSTALGSIVDWWLNLRLMIEHGLVYLPEAFTGFRLRSDSFGNSAAGRDRGSEFEALAEQVAALPPELSGRLQESGQLHFLGAGHLLGESTIPIGLDPHAYLEAVIRGRLEPIAESLRVKPAARTYIYGAGSMGCWVWRVWQDLRLGTVDGFLVTEGENTEFYGLPVQSVEAAELQARDRIVIASKSFEDSMIRTLQSLCPRPAILPIWDSSDH